MGAEITTKVRIGSREVKTKVLLESAEIVIRGEVRMTIPFKEMKSLSITNGALSFMFNAKSIRIELKEKAEKWFDKIKNPKSVLEKLGLKTDSKVSIINIEDKKFVENVKRKIKNVSIGKAVKDSNLIFYEANTSKEVERLSSLKNYLKPNGAIWIVSLKGKAATIKDVEIMKIGKLCGMVDNKVVGFSETHTALKFVIPLEKRQTKQVSKTRQV